MFTNKLKKLNKATRAPEVPALKRHYFKDNHRTYSCIHCRAHLANHDELISKLFQGNHGRAYLFNEVVNVGCKQAVRRHLLTGPHSVADIYCENCETTLGWKYEQAFVASQKYKEGKYIIEVVHMFKENSWDITSYNAKTIIKELDFKSRKKFDLRDFKIGDNYFGSIKLELRPKIRQNIQMREIVSSRTRSLDFGDSKDIKSSSELSGNQKKKCENDTYCIESIEKSVGEFRLDAIGERQNITEATSVNCSRSKNQDCSVEDPSRTPAIQHDGLNVDERPNNCPIK